jgi:GNAT superfamily N-acetyltransferase
MSDNPIIIETTPSQADRQFIEDQLNQFNIEKAGIKFGGDLGAFIRDKQGQILAGITGFCWGNCLRINILWVREDQRGQNYGTQLLQAAEVEGRTRGCHLAFLDTHSFQAPGFYIRQGYAVFSVLDDYPAGYKQYFLKKELKPV